MKRSEQSGGQRAEQQLGQVAAAGRMIPVDLDLAAWRAGAATVLLNRKARSRRLGCQGHVEFQARMPGTALYQALSAP